MAASYDHNISAPVVHNPEPRITSCDKTTTANEYALTIHHAKYAAYSPRIVRCDIAYDSNFKTLISANSGGRIDAGSSFTTIRIKTLPTPQNIYLRMFVSTKSDIDSTSSTIQYNLNRLARDITDFHPKITSCISEQRASTYRIIIEYPDLSSHNLNYLSCQFAHDRSFAYPITASSIAKNNLINTQTVNAIITTTDALNTGHVYVRMFAQKGDRDGYSLEASCMLPKVTPKSHTPPQEKTLAKPVLNVTSHRYDQGTGKLEIDIEYTDYSTETVSNLSCHITHDVSRKDPTINPKMLYSKKTTDTIKLIIPSRKSKIVYVSITVSDFAGTHYSNVVKVDFHTETPNAANRTPAYKQTTHYKTNNAYDGSPPPQKLVHEQPTTPILTPPRWKSTDAYVRAFDEDTHPTRPPQKLSQQPLQQTHNQHAPPNLPTPKWKKTTIYTYHQEDAITIPPPKLTRVSENTRPRALAWKPTNHYKLNDINTNNTPPPKLIAPLQNPEEMNQQVTHQQTRWRETTHYRLMTTQCNIDVPLKLDEI